MTKRDLVNLLADYPDDIPIVVRGFEMNFDDAETLQLIELVRDATSGCSFGEHEEFNRSDEDPRPHETHLLIK